MKQKNGLQQDKLLFIGTNEQNAKLAPIKGLEPPIFLTDSYTAFFCKQSCQNGERWGILSVYLSDLCTERLAPSPHYIKKYNRTDKSFNAILEEIGKYKSSWERSLENFGICVYAAPIQPEVIQKVMIYDSHSKDANIVVNGFENLDPYNISPINHKSSFQINSSISKWLNGEQIQDEDIFEKPSIHDKLTNRLALDLYYLKTEEKYKRKS